MACATIGSTKTRVFFTFFCLLSHCSCCPYLCMHLLFDCTLCANKYWTYIYIYIYMYIIHTVMHCISCYNNNVSIASLTSLLCAWSLVTNAFLVLQFSLSLVTHMSYVSPQCIWNFSVAVSDSWFVRYTTIGIHIPNMIKCQFCIYTLNVLAMFVWRYCLTFTESLIMIQFTIYGYWVEGDPTRFCCLVECI